MTSMNPHGCGLLGSSTPRTPATFDTVLPRCTGVLRAVISSTQWVAVPVNPPGEPHELVEVRTPARTLERHAFSQQPPHFPDPGWCARGRCEPAPTPPTTTISVGDTRKGNPFFEGSCEEDEESNDGFGFRLQLGDDPDDAMSFAPSEQHSARLAEKELSRQWSFSEFSRVESFHSNGDAHAKCKPHPKKYLVEIIVLIVIMALSAVAFYVLTLPRQDLLSSGKGRMPVVLVPGLFSSALEYKLHNADVPKAWCQSNTFDWTLGWVNPRMLLPGSIDCLMSAFQLNYDAEKDEYSNGRGVDLRPMDFGGVDGVYELDPQHEIFTFPIFKPIIDSLKEDGYEVGKDLHGAPYDWRLAGDAHLEARNGVGGFYPNMTRLIEKTVKRNERPVILVSHSFGSNVLLHWLHTFVSDEWRRHHIAGWYSINAPWGGSSKVPAAYARGDNVGLPLAPYSYLKPMEVTHPSGMWMLPQKQVYGDQVVLRTPSKEYKASDWVELFKDLNNTMMLKIWDRFNRLGFSPEGYNRFVPGVPVHFIVSNGIQTPLRWDFDQDLVVGNVTEYVDGDGSVTWSALTAYRQWEGRDSTEWSEEVFPNVNHRDSVINLKLRDSLQKFIFSRMQGQSMQA